VREALESGAGVEAFRRIIEHQGGDPRVVDDYRLLPAASREHRVVAARNGFVSFRAESVGRAAVALGAGRTKLEDIVNPAVGIERLVPNASAVKAGEPLMAVRYDGETALANALPILDQAIVISEAVPVVRPLVLERIVNG
jgi:thymidine phosphorylase